MAATPWKPQFPVGDPALQRSLQSLSDTLQVPWTHVFLLSYNGTTSSATVSDMPSPTATMQYLKLRDTTRMIFNLQCTQYATGGAGSIADIYLSNTGATNGYVSTDPAIAHVYHNAAAAQHLGFGGSCYLDAMPAGVYTLKLRWRSASVTAINSDANDYHFITVTEINANPPI